MRNLSCGSRESLLGELFPQVLHSYSINMMSFLSNPTLEFTAAPALEPIQVEVDAALMEQYQNELKQVCYSMEAPCVSDWLTTFPGGKCTSSRR
jgi:hypothetical protein